jgi:hypothetical protein
MPQTKEISSLLECHKQMGEFQREPEDPFTKKRLSLPRKRLILPKKRLLLCEEAIQILPGF